MEIEAERLWDYFDQRHIDNTGLTVHIGYSHDVLPTLNPTPLDVVFIDGGHGFPLAVIDWFYAAGRLVEGGVLVLDDLTSDFGNGRAA